MGFLLKLQQEAVLAREGHTPGDDVIQFRARPVSLCAENAKLRRRTERAEAQLAKARKVIEVQGNVSALLGELLEPKGAVPDESSER